MGVISCTIFLRKIVHDKKNLYLSPVILTQGDALPYTGLLQLAPFRRLVGGIA